MISSRNFRPAFGLAVAAMVWAPVACGDWSWGNSDSRSTAVQDGDGHARGVQDGGRGRYNPWSQLDAASSPKPKSAPYPAKSRQRTWGTLSGSQPARPSTNREPSWSVPPAQLPAPTGYGMEWGLWGDPYSGYGQPWGFRGAPFGGASPWGLPWGW